MRIELHIGVEYCGASRLQNILAAKRDQMTQKGVRFASAPGNKNHTRLWMAVTDPLHIDPLRFNRGYIAAEKQTVLRDALQKDLLAEVQTHKPETLILSAAQLCWLASRDELIRLRDLLAPLSQDIHITAFVGEQAQVLSRVYAGQIFEGRAVPLRRELDMADAPNWWQAALKDAPKIDPQTGQFLETQAAPFWLDYTRLVDHWDAVFGDGATRLRGYDQEEFDAATAPDVVRAAFGITQTIGKVAQQTQGDAPADAWLARGRSLNALLLQVLKDKKRILPRQLWRGFINEIRIPGAPLYPASLAPISAAFAPANADLVARFPDLKAAHLAAPDPMPTWSEPDPGFGFRASQYLLSFLWRIDKATQDEHKSKAADLARLNGAPLPDSDEPTPPQYGLSDSARALMPPLAVQNFEKLRNSPFAPHNAVGHVPEDTAQSAYDVLPTRSLPDGQSGNVIVGCMKNEAPYILEWVAYHRAIGVDNFLIYTNGCEDGTSEMLDHLQDMGVLQHRLNDDWKGNSPQQFALNRSLEEPVIMNADWIIHIDVDEFMNIRCGNGTLPDLFEQVPEATNIAMTWRLFGHNGVTDLNDDFVIDQFDTCAPKFCPKPHTVWGFKTMFQNIGAYAKISCHRPNKLEESMEGRVMWVNGSGKDMTKEAAHNGWRSSKKSIGYDLIQLNHYALRSAESFLVKRQRGRALHVDRSIGLNYWIRMDWTDHKDLTIKRNLPRMRVEYDRLLQDPKLRAFHEQGKAWHRAKADELHGMPEFQDLYDQALRVKLTATERVAFALALDTES